MPSLAPEGETHGKVRVVLDDFSPMPPIEGRRGKVVA
jgi:hypothetical protein